MVKLFRNPCDVGRADYNGYRGHSFHVTGARFTFNDQFLITIGGNDRSIFLWRHYKEDEAEEDLTSDVEEEVFDAPVSQRLTVVEM